MDTSFRRTFLLLGLLAGFHGQRLLAQEAVGLHVTALTSAERDALNAQLPGQGTLQVVFACVPAGILVVRSAERGLSRTEVRVQARQAVARVVPTERIGDGSLTLEEAEAQCAEARNH